MSRPFASPAPSSSSASTGRALPAPAALAQRLTTATTLLLERERVVRTLGLPASAATDAQVVRALTHVRDGLARWEGEEGAAASDGANATAARDELDRLGRRYDEAIGMMEGQDEIGRLKVRPLKREVRAPEQRPTSPQPVASSSSSSSSPRPLRAAPIERPFRDSPSPEPGYAVDAEPTPGPSPSDPLTRRTPTRLAPSDQPYSDRPAFIVDDDEDDGLNPDEAGQPLDERGLLGAQHALMTEQDDRLALLSTSIAAQTHLSRQIGSELDLHHQLLEETDEAMDHTSERMRGARRRLDRVGRGAKEHGSAITIVVLIVILLLLIVVFKT